MAEETERERLDRLAQSPLRDRGRAENMTPADKRGSTTLVPGTVDEIEPGVSGEGEADNWESFQTRREMVAARFAASGVRVKSGGALYPLDGTDSDKSREHRARVNRKLHRGQK